MCSQEVITAKLDDKVLQTHSKLIDTSSPRKGVNLEEEDFGDDDLLTISEAVNDEDGHLFKIVTTHNSLGRNISESAQEYRLETQTLQEIVAFDQQEILFQNSNHKLIIAKSLTHFVAYEKLKMQNHFLEMITATVSHDMRTPLNAILGVGEELKRYIRQDHNEGITLHTMLMNSSKLLQLLVNDLLDLLRLKNGKFVKSEQNVQFRTSISELVQIFALQAEQKGLKLIIDFHPNLPEILTFDIQRVRQVLTNLIGNSLKYTFKGSIVVSARLIRNLDGQMMLEMTICDTGIGIKEQDRERIFRMFGKLESTEKMSTSGVGLGVSICKKIIEMLGGELTLVSSCQSKKCTSPHNLSQGGTTFQFTVRLQNMDTANIECETEIALDFDNENGFQRKVTENNQQTLDTVIDIFNITEPTSNIWQTNYLTTVINKTFCNIGAAKVNSKSPRDQSNKNNNQSNNLAVPECAIEEEDQSVTVGLICPCNSRKEILLLLKQVGVDSDQALNGLQAVEKVMLRQEERANSPCICGKETSPNYKLIFMDCNMPVMDGIQATKQIRRLFPQSGIRIIALTAYSTQGFEDKCFAVGMDGFTTKPISKEKVQEIVDQVQY
ncbi:hypothetical protein FGO68_gene15673 [Halteria grandinella]|uniref:Histidine kinase n=1 Tax=Halteria grandinella TaxID=5974 RepID=A0A8J8NXB8_HALGN|nr:hypothetical protein FGO68_gene15673 [Halteria grandinella]